MRILGFQTQHPTFLDRAVSALTNPCTSSSERDLELYADHLDRPTSDRLDAALLLSNPRDRAKAFAEVLEGAQGKSDSRCLFAASVRGVRQLASECREPLLELTRSAVQSSDDVVGGALESHLDGLTKTACIGLHAYAENPKASMLGVAADMEDEVGVLLHDLIPTLQKHDGELAYPLEVLRLADLELESNGSLHTPHSAGAWMRELQAAPQPSIPLAFAIALKDDWLDEDDAAGVFSRCRETYDNSGQIRTFASAESEKLFAGRAKSSLVEEWLLR